MSLYNVSTTSHESFHLNDKERKILTCHWTRFPTRFPPDLPLDTLSTGFPNVTSLVILNKCNIDVCKF